MKINGITAVIAGI